MTFTFNSRESYKEYKAQWAKEYAELTVQIRASKLGVRSANRALDVTIPHDSTLVYKIWDAQRHLRKLQASIQEALATRAASKIEAQRQYKSSES